MLVLVPGGGSPRGYQERLVPAVLHLVPPGLVCLPVTDATPSRLVIAWSPVNRRSLVATFVEAAVNASLPSRSGQEAPRVRSG